MNLKRTRKLSAISGAGWTAVFLLALFTLSIGASVHNHSIFGVDGGAEKVSQSNFTCPACVFNGKPITSVEGFIVTCGGEAVPLVLWTVSSFDRITEETSSPRAPPSV